MIYAKKEYHENGDFRDREGARWAVFTCRRIRTKEGVNVGWTEFPGLEDALNTWHLTYDPIPEPEN